MAVCEFVHEQKFGVPKYKIIPKLCVTNEIRKTMQKTSARTSRYVKRRVTYADLLREKCFVFHALHVLLF